MKIILMFGEMGSGKSHLGSQLARELGYLFVEGDNLASPEMQTAIDGLKIITEEMVDDLVRKINQDVVLKHCLFRPKGIVVSQALYRERHRNTLISSWKEMGFDVEARWIKAPTLQHIRQLRSRPGGWKWVSYWLLSKPFFQKPKHEHSVFYNRTADG